jgi:hypothetical protein
MWCAIAMPPYGGFFMAVNPLQKHIFRGAHKKEAPERASLALSLTVMKFNVNQALGGT